MAINLEILFTMSQPGVDSSHVVGGFMASVVLYWFCLAFYRVFLSSLAKFPGPKLAAVTSWYEAFFDLYSSNFPEVLEALHDKYGPVVRINPWELSIRDADFYNEVYVSAGKRRTNLISKNRAGLGIPDSIPTTHSHELHQLRRKAVEGFFSKQSVSRMEYQIHDETKSLDDKLGLFARTDTLVHLDYAFTCVTGDLAAMFACGENPRLLESPDFNPEWYESVMGILTMVPYLRNLPWINSVLGMVPTALLQGFNSRVAGFKMFHMLCKRRVEEVKYDIASKHEYEESDKTSIFHHILQSSLPDSEKDSGRLQSEAFALLAAGTITTATTLSIITYYILADPSIKERLQEDLKDVTSNFPEQVPQWADLEKLPYLTGCIKEGLRLSRFFRRSPRISPDYDLQYKQWIIPKNTPVGMSVSHMLMDPEVYPEPYKFIPERWIGDVDPRVNRNFVPFVKGSRNCLGMNLAWAEMFIVLGVLFRPDGHQMSLDCDETDVILIHDSDFGIPKRDSRGLRVRFQ
ncbi:putative benzoate 4-monooxygenase cytochrome P450 [Jackrogersella minutella]|nr:putative benzoate 4-monooxygenase cytochrome P450 [Jackrogersella minutella]